jgi:hypothetical protein
MAMLPEHTSRKLSVGIVIGAAFSLLIGALALVLAVRGLEGKGGAADVAGAWPNLVTGIASMLGAVGYLRLRKWAVPVYLVAVVGHFTSHTMLFVAHWARGGITFGGMIGIWFVPILAVLILVAMERDRRSGRLT